MPKDYYDVLGVARGASADDIKKAYRKLSKELHPDKHKGDKTAEQRFKEVNEAYEVLSNPQKKQMYDQFGSAGMGNAGAGGGAGFGGFDFSHFNSGDFGSFADLFEGFFRGGAAGGAASRRPEERGGDREVELTTTLAEVLTGKREELSLKLLVRCDRCSGSGAEPGSNVVTCAECGGTGKVTHVAQSIFGRIQQRVVCARCKGSGKVPEKKCAKCDGEGRISSATRVTVDIPAGIQDGQTLRLRGQGDAGRQGMAAGDLYVRIRVRPDPRVERDGDDLRSTMTISVLDAILGAEAPLQTLQGQVTLKIPEGVQPGQVLRLRGQGLPVLQSSRRGDHYVTVKIEIPTRLSRAERKVMEEWKKIR
ncbi:molecular chaperone DnaJ [Candidatus Peregrinibacteria bacterium]|nr:molecular chaperone DnaJ [Candidatus Peregrinibacteria bacterium]MBI3815978.1 molecular chaperone DnaJ [Candidatus Peregrinibacteria bacterium]